MINSQKGRIVAAILIAPFIGNVIGLLFFGSMILSGHQRGFGPLLLIFCMFSYPIMIVFGLPIHLFLRNIGYLDNWLVYGVVGCFLGVLSFAFIVPVAFGEAPADLDEFGNTKTLLGLFAYFGSPGMFTAIVARLIVGPYTKRV